jgi:hypothetical protein
MGLKQNLQVALLQAVNFGYAGLVYQAGRALNEHYDKEKTPRNLKATEAPQNTGPQMLDFVMGKEFTDIVKVKMDASNLLILWLGGE